ncbi:MAG: hypothetical protein JGK05_32755 [Microcoleus sp. PH2017_02_FOX_O_A]|nr:hypothetical protein [Microcoleus sp. PH2017_02_FOX_O_A]
MTQPIALSANTLQNYQGIGVPEASLAVILQRGGDELLLSKVPNRFTVRPSATASTSNNWAATNQAKLNRRVGQSNLEEYLVAPENLDAAMQAARASDAVVFASHVYCPARRIAKVDRQCSKFNNNPASRRHSQYLRLRSHQTSNRKPD